MRRANQTNNTLCNYVNRSGATIDTSQVVQAYGLAVGVACGIGLGLSKLMERGPTFLKRLGPLVPFTAVVAAGLRQVCCVMVLQPLHGVRLHGV